MTTCLVLGGADCLKDDLAAYSGPMDGVVACNDAGAEWPGQLDAWVSFHPDFFDRKGWREKRADNGFSPAKRHIAHLEVQKDRRAVGWGVEFTEYRFPGQSMSGSSGLFAAKVALVDLGFDRAVLCGIPMTIRPHFYGGEAWKHAEKFRVAWLGVPEEYRARMRSMSGWTSVLLGKPEREMA